MLRISRYVFIVGLATAGVGFFRYFMGGDAVSAILNFLLCAGLMLLTILLQVLESIWDSINEKLDRMLEIAGEMEMETEKMGVERP